MEAGLSVRWIGLGVVAPLCAVFVLTAIYPNPYRWIHASISQSAQEFAKSFEEPKLPSTLDKYAVRSLMPDCKNGLLLNDGTHAIFACRDGDETDLLAFIADENARDGLMPGARTLIVKVRDDGLWVGSLGKNKWDFDPQTKTINSDSTIQDRCVAKEGGGLGCYPPPSR